MSQQTGNKQDLQNYLHAWAQMMINIWQEKILLLKVWETGELYDSFISHVLIHSGGDAAKISFAFKYYGFYVNAGVGNEVSVGNDGDLIDVARYNVKKERFELDRKAKPWFDKGWYRSVYALRRDVARIYGDNIAKNIVFELNR
ncbi:MAG: hypothetical protein QM503_03830 [Bacteroidota bacterium]